MGIYIHVNMLTRIWSEKTLARNHPQADTCQGKPFPLSNDDLVVPAFCGKKKVEIK